MMKIFYAKPWRVIILATGVLAMLSCKKEASEKPSYFEPGINGVAVAPLPPIDAAMAQVSLDDLDAVPSHRYTGSLNEPHAAEASLIDEATSEMISSGETEMADDEETFDFSFDDSDDFDSDDANSL